MSYSAPFDWAGEDTSCYLSHVSLFFRFALLRVGSDWSLRLITSESPNKNRLLLLPISCCFLILFLPETLFALRMSHPVSIRPAPILREHQHILQIIPPACPWSSYQLSYFYSLVVLRSADNNCSRIRDATIGQTVARVSSVSTWNGTTTGMIIGVGASSTEDAREMRTDSILLKVILKEGVFNYLSIFRMFFSMQLPGTDKPRQVLPAPRSGTLPRGHRKMVLRPGQEAMCVFVVVRVWWQLEHLLLVQSLHAHLRGLRRARARNRWEVLGTADEPIHVCRVCERVQQSNRELQPILRGTVSSPSPDW